MLEEAYKTGQLKGHQITDAKRLIEKRREKGPKVGGDRPKLPNSAHSLVKTYQREVARQHKLMLKADHAQQQLLLVIQGLKRLFSDENFVTLLRAEGLDSLPKYLADRIETA
jgi:ParB family chromosome partitioning protein